MTDKAADAARRANVTPATFYAAVSEISQYEDKVTTAAALLRNRRKYWKGEGIVLGQMDLVLALKRMDSADVKSNHSVFLNYAKWLKVDLGTQATFEFEEPDQEAQDVLAKYDATRDGRNFGLRGEGPEMNPHEVGTIAFVAWEHGRADNFVAATAKAPKGKPGRKPKKGAGAEMGPDSATAGSA